jgi:predicted phage terminase large subunit-like protein
MAMTKVDRERLLNGNWNILPTAGNVFRREWFPVVDAIPAKWRSVTRYWDRAGTRPSVQNPNPDWTRGVKMYAYPDGTYLIGDLRSARDTPGAVEGFIKNVASYDGHGVKVKSQQDPGQAGKGEGERFIRMLAGYVVETEIETRNKFARAKSLSAQCEAGNVSVLRGAWNDELFEELENFSDNPTDYDHDDIVDAATGAFNDLTGSFTAFNALARLERVHRG